MSKYTEYDKTDEFDVINEKIQELIQLCNTEQVPVFVSVAIANDENHTEYRNDMYASATNNIFLKDDKFPHFVNVINGFRTVPPQKIAQIDFD